jgi:hypothetical protein
MAGRTRSLLALATLLAAAAPASAVVGHAGVYTFTVLRNGSPIGRNCIAFREEGARVEIREATDIEVRLAMIPVYRYERKGREVWENGRALRIDGTTDDNGERLDIAVRRTDGGYTREIDGRVQTFDASMHPLAFWSKGVVQHESFFSVVDDKVLDVSFEFLGREKAAVAGTEIETEHWRMVGDETRDLWFDMAGRIARVEFRRLGSGIAYVRDQLAPAPASLPCG